MNRSVIILLLFLVFFNFEELHGQIRMPAIFSDHMVLQREMNIPVWGAAKAGSKITVEIAGNVAVTYTNEEGKWMAYLPNMKAGGPYDMFVTGEQSITFTDVMIGDVWLASGQSNMNFSLSTAKNGKKDVAEANYPGIRLFTVNNELSVKPRELVSGGPWVTCDSNSVEYFPFLFVQLPGYSSDQYQNEYEWAELREAQLLTLSHPNTGMAVTIDLDEKNNLHPTNKVDVGKRLALAARKIAYGKDVVYSGPIYKSMQIEGKTIRISFTHTGSGLNLINNQQLQGFELAGEDMKFYKANAYIDGSEVVVFSAEVPLPVAVRYAWANSPMANLINREGLPASPFRTDNWKGVTNDKH
jgi:sialate O-acetylesterase